MEKIKTIKDRVYVECNLTNKRVRAKILTKNQTELMVEMPTGYVLNMVKKGKKGPYQISLGQIEFTSDGWEY
jgi:hypothetical protein